MTNNEGMDELEALDMPFLGESSDYTVTVWTRPRLANRASEA